MHATPRGTSCVPRICDTRRMQCRVQITGSGVPLKREDRGGGRPLCLKVDRASRRVGGRMNPGPSRSMDARSDQPSPRPTRTTTNVDATQHRGPLPVISPLSRGCAPIPDVPSRDAAMTALNDDADAAGRRRRAAGPKGFGVDFRAFVEEYDQTSPALRAQHPSQRVNARRSRSL
jgi:hypothetical protein